jgi:hypothetical protein
VSFFLLFHKQHPTTTITVKMKASAVILAAFAALVGAQDIDLSGLPECPRKCIEDALVSVGCTDSACACSKQTELAGAATPCMLTCSPSDLQIALEVQGQMCPPTDSTTVEESSTETSAVESETSTAEEETSTAEETTAEETSTAEETETAEETPVETTPAGNATTPVSTPTPTPNGETVSGAARGATIGMMVLVAGFIAAL